jgi:hypothetical protein
VDEQTAAEPDAGAPDDVELSVPLEVDAPSASTYWTSVPVTGHGPADGTLLFTTAGGGQFTQNLGASGDFCVDVILMSDAVNTIKFEAINPAGEYSDPVLIDVRQDGNPPDASPGPDPTPGYSNIASGAEISDMSVSVESGDVSAIVDGDTSGSVSIRNAATDADWMVIELTERLAIQQIHVETASDCPMESYRILLNDDPNSGPPIEYSWLSGLYYYGNGWTMVGVVDDGTADETIEPAIGDPKARRLAIEFLSGDCGPFVGTGRHKISEIEVWARGDEEPTNEGDPNGAPSCTN